MVKEKCDSTDPVGCRDSSGVIVWIAVRCGQDLVLCSNFAVFTEFTYRDKYSLLEWIYPPPRVVLTGHRRSRECHTAEGKRYSR